MVADNGTSPFVMNAAHMLVELNVAVLYACLSVCHFNYICVFPSMFLQQHHLVLLYNITGQQK